MRRLAGFGVPGALALGWVALWLATVPRGDFPLNDDWIYGLGVRSVLETGRLSLLPWSAANAFAQVYWGALFCKLFGFSYETLRVSTAVLGAVGVMATYGLLREMLVDVGTAALGAAVLGCNPLYLSQSVTFMTDVPFGAVVVVSLWLFARRLRRGAGPEGWAAYGLGLVAVLIRQFAVVLPVAFAVGRIRSRRVSGGMVVLLAGSVAVFLALHLGFQRWMVATHRTSGFESPVSAFLHMDVHVAAQRLRSTVLPGIGLFGMCLFPMAMVNPGRFWRSGGLAAAVVGAGALLAAFYLKHEVPPLPGNIVERFGIGPLTLTELYNTRRYQPALPEGEAFWAALTGAGSWGLAVGAMAMLASAVAVVRGGRDGSALQAQTAMLLGFIVCYGGVVVMFVTIAPLFDRYFIPLFAPMIAVIAVTGGKRSAAGLALGGVLVAGMAGFSVGATHDWLAWQRSRWDAVRFLEARSIPPTKIDGGYEFNGLTTYNPTQPNASGIWGWWVVDNEYMLGGGPFEGYSEIASFPVATWLWRSGVRLVVLHRN